MPLKKNFTLYLLLFVLALSSTESLFFGSVDSGMNHCAGFGHVHNYKSRSAVKYNEIKYDQNHYSDNDDDCHEGKITSGLQIFTPITFIPIYFSFRLVFARVFQIKSNFKTPPLKLFKKPPRLV